MRDLIVVGGGPAGLYTALRAAEEGLDVVVLEEDPLVGAPTHCTGIVSAEMNRLFKVPESLVLGRPAACLIVSPGGHVVEFEDPGEDVAVLDRAGFDRLLAASAAEAGASVLTGRRVDALHVEGGFAEATTEDGERLRARAVVLGCGVTFRFHRLLPVRVPPPVLHTAQIELDATAAADRIEVYFGRRVAPEGFAWLVPIRRGEKERLKAGVVLRGDARAHLKRFLRRPGVARRARGMDGEPLRRLLPIGPVGKSYGERILAVGDAAGLTKPVTGGGIFYSLVSAQLAAETLVEALAVDDLSAIRLAQYEDRWRERLLPEIRVSRMFRQIVAGLTDREGDSFVKALASNDVRSVVKQNGRFNWHRSLIFALLRQPSIQAILLRALFR